MKKPGRTTSKKPVTGRLIQNQDLPVQVGRQLKKHYLNRYGVGRKGRR